MQKLLLSILTYFILASAFAQEKSKAEIKADKYYKVYAYDKAVANYTNTAILSSDGQRKLANSYYLIHEIDKSEEAYMVLNSVSSGTVPMDDYNYAMVLKTNGKYAAANTLLEKFASQQPQDLRAINYLATRKMSSEWLTNQGNYKINHLQINTDADDYGTSYYKNNIVFASSRTKPKLIVKKYNWTGKPFGDIYIAELKDTALTKPSNFDPKLNGILHDGPVSFNADGSEMAFTRNNYNNSKNLEMVSLQIYFSRCELGKWSEPTAFPLNSANYSLGHPHLSPNGMKLYFTSDMPGGYGGTDIYQINKNKDGSWGEAKNLGTNVNTEGDEMFPFFDSKNELLYFSSNGLNGLGGFDLFACLSQENTYSMAYNLGTPVNTQYDDFALICDSKMKYGYFSSNRAGGSGGDDLYAFEALKALPIGKKIVGIVLDTANSPIGNALISLELMENNAQQSAKSDNKGAFSFMVDANKNYQLNAKKPYYFDSNKIVNTQSNSLIIKTEIVLNAIDTSSTINEDLNNLIAATPIYFELDKYNITAEAALVLDRIVALLNENKDAKIQLNAHTDCRAPEAYNLKLSNKRAKASVDYIKQRTNYPERISSKGYGETMPVNNCKCEGQIKSTCSEEIHSKNRRTEFILLIE